MIVNSLMANPNLNQKQRIIIYPQIQERDPEVCCHCQKTCHELGLDEFNPATGKGGLQLHHTSYAHPITDVRYIRFACPSCNRRQELSREAIIQNDSQLAPAHRENKKYRPLFDAWLSKSLQESNFHMPLKEVINGGAYHTGANVQTIKGYLAPHIDHPDAPFTIADDMGTPTLYLKGKEPYYELPMRKSDEFDPDVAKDNK